MILATESRVASHSLARKSTYKGRPMIGVGRPLSRLSVQESSLGDEIHLQQYPPYDMIHVPSWDALSKDSHHGSYRISAVPHESISDPTFGALLPGWHPNQREYIMPMSDIVEAVPIAKEKIDVALESIRKGVFPMVAAVSAGIKPNSWRKAMDRGEKDLVDDVESVYAEFFLRVIEAENQSEESAVKSWSKHFGEDWKATKEFLLRRFPERWASGRDLAIQADGAINISISPRANYEAPPVPNSSGLSNSPGAPRLLDSPAEQLLDTDDDDSSDDEDN